MSTSERKKRPQNLELWLSEVENSWKNIPEFFVDSSRFKHLAIICDGNRRAAKERGLNPWDGHRIGVETIKGIMRAGKKWGISNLTFWTWSTENWKRNSDQVNFVMGLASRFLSDGKALKTLVDNEARLIHLGRKDRLPDKVRDSLDFLETQTAGFNHFILNLALDYGGMDEISRAVSRILRAFESGTLSVADIQTNPNLILPFLDTAGQPPPDLVIRTGNIEGEIPHTSGFMPLQTAYSAWKFLPDLFPELTSNILIESIQEYLDYEMRQGK